MVAVEKKHKSLSNVALPKPAGAEIRIRFRESAFNEVIWRPADGVVVRWM